MEPLGGVRVLDLSRVLSGPFCTMNLGDLGAEVIKIEQPGHGDDTRAFGPPFVEGVSTYYLSVNRNKKSVAIDLKSPEGLELVEKLAQECDVLVENFRPGVAARLGLSHEKLRARNTRLIYCSISGFGHQGLPETSALPGYDVVVQGLSGLQHLTGEPDGPPCRVGVPMADLLAGMTAFQSILAALYMRERTGAGQFLDISMLDATVQVLTYQAAAYLLAGQNPGRQGAKHLSIAPYGTFRAKDRHFNLAVGTDEQFQMLALLLGTAHLAEDPRFQTNRLRVEHKEELVELLSAKFQEAPAAHWLEEFARHGIPAGAIFDLEQALNTPQLEARAMIGAATHPLLGAHRQLGSPLRLRGQRQAATAAPGLGEHTEQVLKALGIPKQTLLALAARKIIGL